MKTMTLSIPRSHAWRVIWVVFTTLISAYVNGSKSVTFSIEEVNP